MHHFKKSLKFNLLGVRSSIPFCELIYNLSAWRYYKLLQELTMTMLHTLLIILSYDSLIEVQLFRICLTNYMFINLKQDNKM